MFHLSLTADDAKRIAWSFIFGFLGFVAVHLADFQGVGSWSAGKTVALGVLGGAIGAGLSAIKNGVLADGSTLK